MGNRTWTNEQFIEAVSQSVSLSEIGRKLGMKNFGANGHTYKKYIKLLNLDTSHFLSKDKLREQARQKITSISDEGLFQVNQMNRKNIKKRIIKKNLLPYACNECGISSWKNKPLSLHLDHINGVNNDNRLSNLQFLCPNCHAQTDSYCGKNKRNVEKKDKVCLDCKCKVHEQSIRCRKCAARECARVRNCP